MKFQISGYKNVSLQLNKPLGSHVEPGRLVIPRLEAGALDMGTGRAGTRVKVRLCLDGVQGQVYPRCKGEGSALQTHCQVIVYHVSQRTLTLSRSSIPEPSQGLVTCMSRAEAFVTGIKIEPRDQSYFWGLIK